MKKIKKIIYPIILLIIVGLGFSMYKVNAKDNSKDLKQKTFSEVKYVEKNLVSLFNLLNNISYENYTIVSKPISKEQSNQNSNNNNLSDSGGSNSTQQSGGNSLGGSESSKNNNTQQENNKEYYLEEQGILTNQNTQIDWDTIKKQVESMYMHLTNMTLDLYQINATQDDILKFNAEYDNLTKAVKNEDKKKTMQEMVLLYDYIPRFIDSATEDENKKIISKTKNNIFKAYSLLDENNWNEILNNINSAVEEVSSLLTTVSEKENKQYNINKCYVIINELKTAIKLQDKEIFLIKYKNLLEELQNI